MIWEQSDVMPRTRIYDVDVMQKVERVIHVDTEASELLAASFPISFTKSGDLATEVIRFRSIYPIYGGHFLPCMFHCYGRIE